MTHEMAVLDLSGDVKTIWDPEKSDEVETARETFNKLRAKGYAAFHVEEKGKKGSAMTKFDPAAGKIILVPPMQGG